MHAASGLDAVIDGEPLGWRRAMLLAQGLALMVIEGFDTYSVGFVAPRLSALWHVPPARLGVVLTAGILGSAIAYVLIGPVADRHGRRRIVIAATACLALSSLLTTTATGAAAFTGWRILTGLALGAALPNIVALCAEYAPARIRSLAIVILYSGFGIGAAIGGLIAAHVVPAFGWRSVFVLGGAAPLLLALAMLALLPESVRFLAASSRSAGQARAVLLRLFPRSRAAATVEIVAASGASRRSPVAALFAPEHRAGTLAIWTVLGLNGAVTAILSFWLTSLFARMGVAPRPSLDFSVWMLVGGVTGAYLAGFLMDRVGPLRVLLSFQSVGCVAIAITAATLATPSPTLGYLLGASLIGGTTGAQSVLANLYPTAIRATGIGWGNSIGRVTGIAAPLLVGLLAGIGLPPPAMIASCLVPALGALGGIAVLRLHRPAAAGDSPLAC